MKRQLFVIFFFLILTFNLDAQLNKSVKIEIEKFFSDTNKTKLQKFINDVGIADPSIDNFFMRRKTRKFLKMIDYYGFRLVNLYDFLEIVEFVKKSSTGHYDVYIATANNSTYNLVATFVEVKVSNEYAKRYLLKKTNKRKVIKDGKEVVCEEKYYEGINDSFNIKDLTLYKSEREDNRFSIIKIALFPKIKPDI